MHIEKQQQKHISGTCFVCRFYNIFCPRATFFFPSCFVGGYGWHIMKTINNNKIRITVVQVQPHSFVELSDGKKDIVYYILNRSLNILFFFFGGCFKNENYKMKNYY